MSFEEQPKETHSSEGGPEHIPTAEEVRSVFEQLTGNSEWEEVSMRDEKGLYLWDIKISGENGETAEYSYMRKGRYPEGEALRTAIHVAFFDAKGMPGGGHSVGDFETGEWRPHK